MKRRYGRIKEIEGFASNNKAWLYNSARDLRDAFVRNAELLKKIDRTVNSQIAEIFKDYGIRLSANVMSELKHGKRYNTGYLTLQALKNYWLQKGYCFKMDE